MSFLTFNLTFSFLTFNFREDIVNVYTAEKEMIYLKGTKVCASRNIEYLSEVFQMSLVVPHFSKSAVRKLKPVKLHSTTGVFCEFSENFQKNMFLQNISRRLFLSFWNNFWSNGGISLLFHFSLSGPNLVYKCFLIDLIWDGEKNSFKENVWWMLLKLWI